MALYLAMLVFGIFLGLLDGFKSEDKSNKGSLLYPVEVPAFKSESSKISNPSFLPKKYVGILKNYFPWKIILIKLTLD